MKSVLKTILLISLIGSITVFFTGCGSLNDNVEKEAVKSSSSSVQSTDDSSSSSAQSADDGTDKSTSSSAQSADDDTDKSSSSSAQSTDDTNNNKDYDSDNNKMYTSLEEYISSNEVQNMVDSMNSNTEEFEMKIKAEDNALIYEYIYTEQISEENIALVEKTLKEAAKNQETVFNNVLDSIKLFVDVDSPVVLLRYYNADGTLLAEIEFTGE